MYIFIQSKLNQKRNESQFRIIAFYDVRCFLCNHDNRDVDVSARNVRDHGRIHYPETSQAPDFEFGVDDGVGIRVQGSHFAATHGVVVRGGEMEDPAMPVFVRFLEKTKQLTILT